MFGNGKLKNYSSSITHTNNHTKTLTLTSWFSSSVFLWSIDIAVITVKD